MKTTLHSSCALLAGALLILTTSIADARAAYGSYSGSRGGSAVVTPRGAAVQGPNGGTAARSRYGGAAAVGPNGGVAVRAPVAAVRPLPGGYIRTVPAGYRTVVYGGYNCMFVGGIYYRAVMYQGSTVYVVVK